MSQQFNPFLPPETPLEIREHQQMLMDLSLVLKTEAGKNLIKYFFKSFGVTELPPRGLPNDLKDEYLGFLRAGQSIFEIVSQADTIKAGLILAEIQKEKYDAANAQNSNGQR